MSLFLPSSQGSDGPAEAPVSFTASTNQISHLAEVFSSITAVNNQALMIISPKGFIIYSEYNHILNVQLRIDPSLFSTYSIYADESVDQEDLQLKLGVDISLISESFNAAATSKLSSLGGSSAVDNVICYISYKGEGFPLVIEFEDRLINEKIEFYTFHSDMTYPYDDINSDPNPEVENYNLVINHSEVHFELILKSDVLANLLQDLTQIGTIDLYIFVSNKRRRLGESLQASHTRNGRGAGGHSFIENQLNFISKGLIGHLKLLFPNSKGLLEKLSIYEKSGTADKMNATNASLITCFNFNNFIKIFKAVKLSTKCKIMKDLSGVLSLQLLCKNPKLANYSGTLITFNMLEITNLTGQYDEPEENRLNLNNIFDDDFYDYIHEYNQNGSLVGGLPLVNEYEELNDGVNPTVPPLSYASFKQRPGDKDRETHDEEQNDVRGTIEVPLFF